MNVMSGKRIPPNPGRERGTTYIELVIMSLIATIMLVAIATAVKTATKGSLSAKERSRALTLAQDRLEEVKNMGYGTLGYRFSGYYYPDFPTTGNVLVQSKDRAPWAKAYNNTYDAAFMATYTPDNPGPVMVANPGEDPWTPEVILMGKTKYWRHVVVKFVADSNGDGKFVQVPEPNPPIDVGGTNPGSNLAYIQVDVAWRSRTSWKHEKVSLSTLLANPAAISTTFGRITGTVWDMGGPAQGCFANLKGDGIDDKWLTWAKLVITARNILTDEKFQGTLGNYSGYGGYAYRIDGLPTGTYEVLVSGAPLYLDGGYNAFTCPPDPTHLTVGVTITSAAYYADYINIWIQKVKKVRIFGCFVGVSGTDGFGTSNNAQDVWVSANDGASDPLNLSVTVNCDSSSSCWFQLNDVAWPTTNHVLYSVNIANKSNNTIATAYICADAALLYPAPGSIADFAVGYLPPVGMNACGAGCKGETTQPFPLLGADCVFPGAPGYYDPLNVGYSVRRVRVKVKVREYYNGMMWDLTPGAGGTAELARIAFLSQNDGVSVTLPVYSAADPKLGTTIFENYPTGEGLVPIQDPPTIRFRAYATTTGYDEDTYFLPFKTESGFDYCLIEGDGWASSPGDITQRYTFVLKRVSAVSGTVWLVAGSKGFPNATVKIVSSAQDWSAATVADGQGRFYIPSVPVHFSNTYKVSPVGGSDYLSVPSSRDVTVDAHGLVFKKDNSGNPLDFVMTAINGLIRGTISHNNQAVNEGALVIVSTYNGAFPATLPSTALTSAYTYSTVTLSDGSYSLRVATGVGSYYVYVFFRQTNSAGVGTDYTCGPCAGSPVTVVPGSEATCNVNVTP